MRRKNIIKPKRESNVLQVIIMLLGLALGAFGLLILKNNTDAFLPLVITIVAVFLFLSGLWMSTEVLIIRKDILEKSNFFGLIKTERNLKNLRSIKRRKGNVFKGSSNNLLVLFSPFLKNPKYSNFTSLTLTFKNEKKLGLSELMYKKKDFISLSGLLKNYTSRNRKRFRKEENAQ